ncbi:MAG: DNA gyrase inhibitor YacG [Terriglobales bacterium]
MPKKKLLSLRCPICRTLVLRTQEDFPFCSERCRTIDLGKWASGGYVISTKINDPELLEDIAEQQSKLKRDPDGHSEQ